MLWFSGTVQSRKRTRSQRRRRKTSRPLASLHLFMLWRASVSKDQIRLRREVAVKRKVWYPHLLVSFAKVRVNVSFDDGAVVVGSGWSGSIVWVVCACACHRTREECHMPLFEWWEGTKEIRIMIGLTSTGEGNSCALVQREKIKNAMMRSWAFRNFWKKICKSP